MNKPLCFVLMPFGKKMDGAGLVIDFDTIYYTVIAPAIEEVGLEALRADDEINDSLIHRSMFERLIYCEYAVADLTTANANVFYELGIRHALRPYRTILMYAGSSRLPFDVAPLRAMLYEISKEGVPADPQLTRNELAGRLRNALLHVSDPRPSVDSPIYDLFDNFPSLIDKIPKGTLRTFQLQEMKLARVRADIFATRDMQADAALAELLRIQQELEPLQNQDPQLILDLFLAYRSISAWPNMIALIPRMPAALANNITVREQHAQALNRSGKSAPAEKVLQQLLKERGPSSETYGMLGRVYKDRWKTALGSGNAIAARGWLTRAIQAYRSGFEADWRDAYPGINACTLMEALNPPDPERLKMLPLIDYAVQRKISSGNTDYWDYATELELAVHLNDRERAFEAVAQLETVVLKPEQWQPRSTLDNLQLIRGAREARGEVIPWLHDIEELLLSMVARLGSL